MRCNREALLALMQPFLVLPNGDELDRLLHHRNKEGENLLAYVSHHNKVYPFRIVLLNCVNVNSCLSCINARDVSLGCRD